VPLNAPADLRAPVLLHRLLTAYLGRPACSPEAFAAGAPCGALASSVPGAESGGYRSLA
jgi:hypothetical protein